jgi:2-oxoglutarate ferredoxin oxidoreductase subunit alpha
MDKSKLVIRLGGEGGEGIISCGEILSLACARMGKEIYGFKTYPAEIKGGYAMFQICVDSKVLLSQGSAVDILICFNQEAYDRNVADMNPEGSVILYDETTCSPHKNDPHIIHYPLPASSLARQETQNYLTKNNVFMGAVSKLFGVDPDVVKTIVKAKLGKKGDEMLRINFLAVDAGYHYVEKNIPKRDPFFIQSQKTEEHVVLTGNQALTLGAIAAGCRFYAGYPITPATDIMEFLSRVLPRFGGSVIQAEDEIAALSMVLGAGYAGAKAMTATSGPGLSLMAELTGLAGMAEIPAVIADVQRAGPSTGMPTKTEQSDLNHALYGGHGEFPRIVMALTSVQNCFWGMIQAFNYAVRYQVPVIVLSDQYLAQRSASIPRPDLSKIQTEELLTPSAEDLQGYKRFLRTATGISPMALPGQKGGVFTATGIEHEENCRLTSDPKNHWLMTEKRFKKLSLLAQDPTLCRYYGAQNPKVGVLGWGSSEGVIREAVERANELGMKVGMLHPTVLCPMPQAIGAFIRSCEKVIVPELNYTGQFRREIYSTFGLETIPLNQLSGLPFRPSDILKKIEEVYRG